MATSVGPLDPGALLHLLHTGKADLDSLDRALNHESGLAGPGAAAPTCASSRPARIAATRDASLALDVFSPIGWRAPSQP